MSHVCGRRSSEKADSKSLNCKSKTDGQHKMKRLQTRKKRSQMRNGWKETSKTKSHHQHCRRQSNNEMAHFHNCCHGSCLCPSRIDAPFPRVVPVTQEPSIITDSRLIGHHGLFNHEVKSIDIERFLSTQRKLEQSGKRVIEKNNVASHLSATSHIPASFSSLLEADSGFVVSNEKELATKSDDDCQQKEKKNPELNSQGSDATPRRRPQQQLSSGSLKSISSKNNYLCEVTTKTKEVNYVPSEKGQESQLTPTVERDHVKTLKKKVKRPLISTPEQTLKNRQPHVHQRKTDGLSPSPLQLSSPPTADSFDIQQRRLDPEYVSRSVSTVAARLCDYLQFPRLRGRNLVSESREVLLKSLQERHGPWLQENLLKVQRCLNFGLDATKAVQDQEPTMMGEDEHLPADTSVKMTGSRYFNWTSSLQPLPSREQTAEWLASPVDTSVGGLHDIVRPSSSSQFCMDFEPSGVSASHLFSPSPTLFRAERASVSEHWEDRFNRSDRKESVMFDIFENSFMSHTRAIRERNCEQPYHDINFQPYSPYQAQLPDRYSAERMHFPQEQDLFETTRYSSAPTFSAQILPPPQSNHFQPFSQVGRPSTYPPLRSHHTDMMHYPPSHMLENGPAPPLAYFPSPEHWSFPPMRLY